MIGLGVVIMKDLRLDNSGKDKDPVILKLREILEKSDKAKAEKEKLEHAKKNPNKRQIVLSSANEVKIDKEKDDRKNPFIQSPEHIPDKNMKRNYKFNLSQLYLFGRFKTGVSVGPELDLGVTTLRAQVDAVKRFDFCISKSGITHASYPYFGVTVGADNIISASWGLETNTNKFRTAINGPLNLGYTFTCKDGPISKPSEQCLFVGKTLSIGIPYIANVASAYVEAGISFPDNKKEYDPKNPGEYEMDELVDGKKVEKEHDKDKN